MSHCHTSFVPFYLCRSGDHIDSPSFPTRRSSDLSTMQTRFDLPPLLLCCDAARLLRREINERNRDLGLSEPPWRVVGVVRRLPGARRGVLGVMLGVGNSPLAERVLCRDRGGWSQMSHVVG